MHFITRATPIDIKHRQQEPKNGTEKQQELFNQSYKVKITPLVISVWPWEHTYMHAYQHESDFRNPGTCWPAAGVCLV